MKLTREQEAIIERATNAYVSVDYPSGSQQESVAREAHSYGMRRILATPEKYGLMPIPAKDVQTHPHRLNVYNINFGGENYWIRGRTDIEAIQAMVTEIGINLFDFGHDDSIEIIPPDKWPHLNIVDPETDLEEHDELEVLETLAQHMETAKTPGFIASTDY